MKTIEEAAQEYSERYSNQPYQQRQLIKAVFQFGAEFALSNWISVEDTLPERIKGNPYPDCLFVVSKISLDYAGQVFAGFYAGDPNAKSEYDRALFSTPGSQFIASHWMYSPKPPKK